MEELPGGPANHGEHPATGAALHRGRQLFGSKNWGDAFTQLSDADRNNSLGPEDLERLATAAYLTGRDAESAEAWARAHQEFLGRNDVERAARSAFWLAFGLLNQGENARAGGWLTRAERLLDGRSDCVEQGYLLFPVALRYIFGGNNAEAFETFGEAAEIGERFHEPDLIALARHGQGRALLRMGETGRGVTLLDEAMAAVDAGEVSPIAAGDIYCSVIEGCHEIFDLRRAQQWTAALARWCDSQQDLVPYRGECLVRRAEILELHGEWLEAAAEATRACEWLSRPPVKRALGAALYRFAELRRLQGEFAEAEEAYRRASQSGRRPEPGLSLLRLSQGKADAAQAGIQRVVDETPDGRLRAWLLPAYVEIMLASGHVAEARAAAEELGEIARDLGASFLHVSAAHAEGAVLLAEENASSALLALRRAWDGWRELDAPYEAARVRVLVGLGCRQVGDDATAELEFDAARHAFERLGAVPDVARVDSFSSGASSAAHHGLSPRELEVLRLVATGQTNKAIGRELYISERTVDRHVSNIFTKLQVSSRAAATAYAYEHALI